jgi:hypothetical protein
MDFDWAVIGRFFLLSEADERFEVFTDHLHSSYGWTGLDNADVETTKIELRNVR